MSLPIYLSFAVAPILIIIGAIILKVSFKIKNWVNIRNAILLGIFSVVFVVIANYLAEMKWHGNYNKMKTMAFFVFVVIGFSAEFGKFLALRLGFYRLKTFEGPIEGIIYSNFIGLGYSLTAVVLFGYDFIGAPRINDFTLFLFIYPFANLVFSTCLGFFIGMGKIRSNGLIDNATGLFVATFFHGLYYFSFITSDIRLQILIGIGFIMIAFVLLARAIKLRNMKD
jgi:protease PrsW